MSDSFSLDFKGIDRFLIRRRLGAGGFGIVYEAYDQKSDIKVALKTLRQIDAEAIYRFKREFRALADLTHPNLVTLYELISDGEQWFFTMELIEGVNFFEYTRSANQGQLDSTNKFSDCLESNVETLKFNGSEVESAEVDIAPPVAVVRALFDEWRLRAAMQQLAAGVCALHNAGKLHRDIKPSNVLATKEGRVVILDFGLIRDNFFDSQQSLEQIAGTPAYMSPEQGAGRELSEASDWYAVGTMLFEAMTGQLPFVGKPIDILMKKQKVAPPPPNSLVSGIPDDLNQLCQELLQIDARQRPSGHEILRRLEATQSLAPAISDAFRAPIVNAGAVSTSSPRMMPLMGRQQHLAKLMAAFEEIKQGNGVTIYLHGKSGMGKSVLISRFLDDVKHAEKDLVVLAGRCYEQESVPYKAFDGVVDAVSRYLKHLSALEAEALLPLDVLALAKIFPVLMQVAAVARGQRKVLEIPDAQELRRRAFGALRELLARLGNKKRLIIFIDDLQWGDLDSAPLLDELLRPPLPPTMLFICSFRSEEAATSPLLKTFLAAHAHAQDLVVGELSLQEGKEFALTLLGESNAAAIARAEAIAKESGGSPFFIDELARYASGATESASLDDVIHARVSQLPEAARSLLEIIAVAGQPLEQAVAKQTVRLDIEEPAVLASLRAGRFIRSTKTGDTEKLETYHDRIRETIVAHLAPAILKAHHHRLALALEAASRIDAETLTIHFQAAGELEKAAKYAVVAAEEASKALAFDRAANFYKLALELHSAQWPERRSIRVKLGDALVNAGRGVESARVYLQAVEGAGNAEALDLQRRAAEQFLRSGYIDEGFSTIDSVLKKIGVKLIKTPWLAFLSFIFRRAQLSLRGLGFKERDAKQIPPEELMRIDACWSIALGLSLVDNILGADFQARHLLLALKAGEPYRTARALALEAGFSSSSGSNRHRATEKLVQVSKTLATRIDHPHAIGLTTFISGAASYHEGHWKDAYKLLTEAEKILRERCYGVTWELDSTRIYMLMTLGYMGELNELSQRLPTFLKEAQERGDQFAESYLRLRLLYLARIAEDEPNKIQQEIDQAIAKWSQQRFQVLHYFVILAQTNVALYSGNYEQAWHCINDGFISLRRSLQLYIQIINIEALQLRANSALAMASKAASPELFLNAAEKDARRMEREKALYGNALAQLIRAGIAAARGKSAAAINLLVSAEAGFEAANMALYLAIAKWQRGKLIGGDKGQALIKTADEWMGGQKIKNPERMIAMLAPGKWRD